jgi:hypothetical protein
MWAFPTLARGPSYTPQVESVPRITRTSAQVDDVVGRRVSAAFSATCPTRRLSADSPLWAPRQPIPCEKPSPLPRTPAGARSCSTTAAGLSRALPATDGTGSAAMSALPKRSDAARHYSPRGRCRRMGQLMSRTIIDACVGYGAVPKPSPRSASTPATNHFRAPQTPTATLPIRESTSCMRRLLSSSEPLPLSFVLLEYADLPKPIA